MRVRDVMSRTVVTVRPHDSIRKAAALLVERGFTALPVVGHDGDLVGIVTEADLIPGRLPHDPRLGVLDQVTGPGIAGTVGDVMTCHVTVTTTTADVAVAARAMLDQRRRALPVVEDGRLAGIVTRRDLMRVVARDDDLVAADVRHRLDIYGGPGRFTVTAHDGVVVITDEHDDPADAHTTRAVAAAIPGVATVRVVHAPS